MNIPAASVKELLEAGVHLGHKTFRWNPKMKKFIFGEKNSIHIIDLLQTVKLLNNAMLEMHKCVASGGKILFVSTKKQASELIAEVAKETGQFFVNHRWPGGMLTNWKTTFDVIISKVLGSNTLTSSPIRTSLISFSLPSARRTFSCGAGH